MFDTLVIGGGPAGLQAALTLGRMHREVLLLDSGAYRNGSVDHAHNFITLDGVPPAEIRDRALRDVAAYDTVQVRRQRVDSIEGDDQGFVARVGEESIRARTLVLATGLSDALPDIAGLAQVWGAEAASCPFCHGHELAGQQVGLLAMGEHGPRIAAMLAPIVEETIELDDVVRIERITGGLRLHRAGGDSVEVGGVFVKPSFSQSAPFAEQLGLTLLDSGCVEVDIFGRTSLPGVYAAGDLAHHRDLPLPMASVLAAASAGLVAAATCAGELAMSTA